MRASMSSRALRLRGVLADKLKNTYADYGSGVHESLVIF
jgi:hypothetical protein